MVIYTRFLLIFLTFFSYATWAMKSDHSVIAPDQFPLHKIAQDCAAAQRLKKLQTVANFLVLQTESYQSLKKIIPVMEVLHELQPYRVIDQEGKKFLSGFVMNSTAASENRYGQQLKKDRVFHYLNVHSSEANALALQAVRFLSDWKLKSAAKVHSLDQYVKHEDGKIREVAGLVKHYAYSYQLAHLVFAAPYCMHSFNKEILDQSKMDSTLLDFFKFDSAVYGYVMRLPYMRDMIASLAQLIDCYRISGSDDDFFEMYVDATCLDEIDNAKKIFEKFEPLIPKFQKLYEQVRNEMARIIMQATRDREQQKELKSLYVMRILELFNINQPRKLEESEDLPLHYTVKPELPLTLDYTVSRLVISAPAAISENKKSFLPPSLSKSAPVARKPQASKKRNMSQPTSRSQSPVQFELSSHASPEEVQKVVEPQAVHAVAPVAPKLNLENILYDSRVLRWFDPHTLDEQVLKASRECIEYHCFTRLVDHYLLRYGVQTRWQNKAKAKRAKDAVWDMNYSLGGSIESRNHAKELVVFNLCKDQRGVCYHRGFNQKENNALFNEYFEKNHWEIFHRDEFPALGVAQNAPFAQLDLNANDEVVSEDDLCVKIRDNHMDMNIVLYKPTTP